MLQIISNNETKTQRLKALFLVRTQSATIDLVFIEVTNNFPFLVKHWFSMFWK